MEALDPISVSAKIADDYRRYLSTLVVPKDQQLAGALRNAISEAARGGLTKGPYLEIAPPYATGASIRSLIDEGILHEDFSRFESDALPLHRPLYAHQEQAIRSVSSGRNVVVATGTGSGKTESFLIPILDHLQRESAAGRMGPGVRALLLYPMNALANDQLKRLRQVLADVPDVTFGRYTGETDERRQDARAKFKAQHPGQAHIPNELLSREEMRATPPNLLLTNYAMLEYLLLRPLDMDLFSKEKKTWKFLVVDEAHVYDGATGAEVAYLIRRLRERVSSDSELQYIATSATVGNDRARAAHFAESLFGAPFEGRDARAGGDIVTAVREPWGANASWGSLSAESLRGRFDDADLVEVARQSGSESTDLYGALSGEQNLSDIVRLASEKPRTIEEILGRLSPTSRLEPSSVRDLIEVASKTTNAEDSPLLAAKYHLFARATEGAFSCLSPAGPHVSLARREHCEDCGWSVFELAACSKCGGTYFAGTIDQSSGLRVFLPKAADAGKVTWLSLSATVGEKLTEVSERADEDDLVLDESEPDATEEEISLCGRCGTLDPKGGSSCINPQCGNSTVVKVVRVGKPGAPIRKCIQCGAQGARSIRRFESGNDASVSVLTTSLYQSLPPAGGDEYSDRPGGGRKLLVFSDSRQQAAYFAPYLERTYGRVTQRRLLFEAVKSSVFEGEPASPTDIARSTRGLADRAEFFESTETALAKQSTVEGWLQRELSGLDDRISLEGVGLVRWELMAPTDIAGLAPFRTIGFDDDEALALLQELVRSLRLQGALSALPRVNLKDAEFEPRLGPIYVRGNGSDVKRKVLSWSPTKGRNRRSDYLKKVVSAKGIDPEQADRIQSGVWRMLEQRHGAFSSWFVPGPSTAVGAVMQLNIEAIRGKPVEAGDSLWRCEVCSRASHFNVANVCSAFNCEGSLRSWELPRDEQDDNHYRSLYRGLKTIPMKAMEHTAQWSSERAATIQQDFIAGRTNVLSCSTTFELGVDVGELQSVMLRNVPPTVANYVQRAGESR